MIVQDNFVSISELRDKTSSVIKSAQKVGKKIILSQNKPIGVFLSIEEYNSMRKLAFESEPATEQDIKAYAKSSHGKGGVEAFSFLDSLQ